MELLVPLSFLVRLTRKDVESTPVLIMPFGETLGAILTSRVIGGFVSKITQRIFPFKGSSEEERIKYQHNLSEHQAEIRREFEEKLHAAGMENQREIAQLSMLYNRQTALQNSVLNFSYALKSKLFDEALKNYPLNIPPIVMLRNAGVTTDAVTGDLVIDDPIAKDILSITNNGNNPKESLLSRYRNIFRHYPIALNFFVTPLMLDSRVLAHDKIANLVWDNVYQSLESLFINEYNRSGKRPVNFYPAAWNQNAKPGLHAAEILYFFTKGMPVAVLEPRYDGKQLRFIFSCWGIGSEPDKQIRQEITFDMNWNSIVLSAMYERSVDSLKRINQLKDIPPLIADSAKKKMEHNILMYKQLQSINALDNNPITDDISKLFHLTTEDYSPLSKLIADAMGISMSLIADVHHLTSRGISPHFPELLKTNFNEAFQSLAKPNRQKLLDAIKDMMKSAYMELLLGECIGESDYPTFETSVDEHFKWIDSDNSIMANLEKIPDVTQSESSSASDEKKDVIEYKSIQEILSMIDERCSTLNIDAKTLAQKVEILRSKDAEFIAKIEELCEPHLVTLNELTGK